MKIYLVGDYGPEHYTIKSIHKTYKGALKAWNKHRMRLLSEAGYFVTREPKETMWKDMVKNLSCKDPKKMDNDAWDTPYIQEKDVVD